MSYSVGIIIISDRAYSGEREDKCLDVFKNEIDQRFEIVDNLLVNDDYEKIKDSLLVFIKKKYRLIITAGGTGCSPRDNTPEATREIIKKFTPGLDEAVRAFSRSITPNAIFSRAVSGITDESFIINFPGSPKAIKEILEFLLPIIEHPLRLIANQVEDCQKELNNENIR